MNLLDRFKSLLAKLQTMTSEAEDDYYTLADKVKKRLLEVAPESEKLEKEYGADFYAFLYRPDLDAFLKSKVLDFKSPQYAPNQYLDNNHWNKRHPFNFPGPFYTGESDTCGTGVEEAPVNVLNDVHNTEYIFRQPANYSELVCVLEAADVEVLDSYSGNGNEYWTYALCREWWRNRDQVLQGLYYREGGRPAVDKMYADYLNGAAELDVRKYCYFLENGRYPAHPDIVLPDL